MKIKSLLLVPDFKKSNSKSTNRQSIQSINHKHTNLENTISEMEWKDKVNALSNQHINIEHLENDNSTYKVRLVLPKIPKSKSMIKKKTTNSKAN